MTKFFAHSSCLLYEVGFIHIFKMKIISFQQNNKKSLFWGCTSTPIFFKFGHKLFFESFFSFVFFQQPSGIGQRPRPVTQDDGNKSSCFIAKTTQTSSAAGDAKSRSKDNLVGKSGNFNSSTTTNVPRKHSKTLNYG